MGTTDERKKTTILAGDIGGTKTDLAIFTTESGSLTRVTEATFPSREYPSLENLARDFLSQIEITPDCGSFGVAGPVVNGRAKITNLPWVMDESELSDALGLFPVYLLNDLMALANAVPFLTTKDIHVLNKGRGVPDGTIAVIAPGTGLGEAYLPWDGTRRIPCASEGGHADFAPINDLEIGLLTHLMDQFDHVSYERVCSGQGLVNIYNYLKEIEYAGEASWVTEMMGSADDIAPVIVKGALEMQRPCSLCRAALDRFISILGAEAGNLCLKVMASGGLYIGGGIPPKIMPGLETELFMTAFKNKGRMSGLLENIPVYVILNPNAALIGAAHYVSRK